MLVTWSERSMKKCHLFIHWKKYNSMECQNNSIVHPVFCIQFSFRFALLSRFFFCFGHLFYRMNNVRLTVPHRQAWLCKWRKGQKWWHLIFVFFFLLNIVRLLHTSLFGKGQKSRREWHHSTMYSTWWHGTQTSE